MNIMVRKIWKIMAIVLVLCILVEGCGSIRRTIAIWYTDSLPKNVVDGSQPAIGSGGVSHQVSVCKQTRSGDLLYRARFTNPYSETLNAFIGTSLDGGEFGTIWGIYTAELPPGLTEITFDTSKLDKEDRDKLLYSTLPFLNITYYVNECSVHIFGFEEGPDFQVTFPVAYKKFSSTFELPKTSP